MGKSEPDQALASPATPDATRGFRAKHAAPVSTGKSFEKHIKIHPRTVEGRFHTWRWLMVWLTQVLYYGLAWLPWNGRQAVLFDLAERKFYIFGLVLWPQDFIYLTGLLIISAYSLFLFTAIAGRLFCGYACPQTVYTTIFTWIEERIEGKRHLRIKLDEAPLLSPEGGYRKLRLRALKYSIWVAIALWTGFTFVGYFTPIRQYGPDVLSGNLGGWAMFWMFFYAGFTVLQAGFLREQVCKTMCPYARFQSVMYDRDTLVVAYDERRGEPRGKRPKSADLASSGLGSCVDCGICVEVCPTGIDIRKGLQYECIGCGACVDGCNEIMDKMNYPRGLIKYASLTSMQPRKKPWDIYDTWERILRPRTMVYSTILWVIVASWGAGLLVRNPIKVDVIRDRGALARELDGGVIENVYRLQLMNTSEDPVKVELSAEGLPGLKVLPEGPIDLGAAESHMVAVRVQAPPETEGEGSHKIHFIIKSSDGHEVVEHTTYYVPSH
jgi:cytochrome c oxidase accessory protein FixG